MMAIGQGQWDDNDVMVMDGQQHAECLQVGGAIIKM
jgi:hypothetical protein